MIGNIVKYLTRYEQKNGVEDLEKAQTYLQRLADFEKSIDWDYLRDNRVFYKSEKD